MKKVKIMLTILIITTIIIFPFTVNAGSGAQINPSNYKSSGPNTTDVDDMYKFGGSIAGVIQIVGTMVSAGAMIIIGIRYMIASAEEKAEYKERMLPYFIGAILLFGASNIIKILYSIIS